MERRVRTRLLTIGVLVVVFGSGVSLGVSLDRSLGAPASGASQAHEYGSNSSEWDDDRSRRQPIPMWEQVGPSDEQRARIDSIMRRQQGDMRSLQKEFEAAYNPRYRTLIVQTREAIKGVLTLEQSQQYDSLVAEFDGRRSQQRSKNDHD